MHFNLESSNNEVNEKLDINSGWLVEKEKIDENFEDCALDEIQNSNVKEVGSKSLKEAEDNYADYEAKIEEMEEKNPQLVEEDYDFNDCGKETDNQYVAEVIYTTDGEINQEKAGVELQEAYNECDDSEDMRQLKENANENEHIEVYNAEVIEHPENDDVDDEIVDEEYEQVQEELVEAQETLEVQQEATQEYSDDLENQINKHEKEVPEKINNKNHENVEDNKENMAEIEEDSDILEVQKSPDEMGKNVLEPTENINETTETSDDNTEDVKEDISSSKTEKKNEVVESDDLEQKDENTKVKTIEIDQEDDSEDNSQEIEEETKIEFSDEIKERIINDVSSVEINDLREENAKEFKTKIEEKATIETELKSKFNEVLSKEKGSEEYKQSLKEYNALQDKKSNIYEQISEMEKQQGILDEKSIELRNEKIIKGNEVIEASKVTFMEVNTLYDRYEDIYYDEKVNEDELARLKTDGYLIIKELSFEQDIIKEAMNAKMDEISEYVISKNMNKYETTQDFYYQQLSAEYTKMKECYDKIDYSIVKLDENNKSIAEQLGDKYISIVDSQEFAFIINDLEEMNVSYHPIELSDKERTTDEIIERLSGGDLTEGSCSSLALAYAGNKAGYDVLDFRDGESRSFFSSRDLIRKIANLPNIDSKIIYGKNDIECVNNLFKKMEVGKEYYLATGQHASIVKRNKDSFEYLELQHPSSGNGWHNLDNDILISRFGCKSSHSFEFSNFLIDVDSLSNSSEFLGILGYINTSGLEQRKGVKGDVR